METLPTFSAFLHNLANVYWAGCSPSNSLRIPKDWLTAFSSTPTNYVLALGEPSTTVQSRDVGTAGVLPKSDFLKAEENRAGGNANNLSIVVVDGVQYDAREKHYVRLQRVYGELSESAPTLPPGKGFSVLMDPSTNLPVLSTLNTVDRMLWALIVRNAASYHHYNAPDMWGGLPAEYYDSDSKRLAYANMINQTFGTITNVQELFVINESLGDCLLGCNFAKLFDRHFCSGDPSLPSSYGGVKTWVVAAFMYLYSPSVTQAVVNGRTSLCRHVERTFALGRPKSDMYGIGVDLCLALDNFRRNYAAALGNGGVLASRFGTPCVDYLYAFQTIVYKLLYNETTKKRTNVQLWWSHHYDVEVGGSKLPSGSVDEIYAQCIGNRKFTLVDSAVPEPAKLKELNEHFTKEVNEHLKKVMLKVLLPAFSKWFASDFFHYEQRVVKNIHQFIASMSPDADLLYNDSNFQTQFPGRSNNYAHLNAMVQQQQVAAAVVQPQQQPPPPPPLPGGVGVQPQMVREFDPARWLQNDRLVTDYIKDYNKENISETLGFYLMDKNTMKMVPNAKDVLYKDNVINVAELASIIKQEATAKYKILFPFDKRLTVFPYEVFFGEQDVRRIDDDISAVALSPIETCAVLHANTCKSVSENIVTTYR